MLATKLSVFALFTIKRNLDEMDARVDDFLSEIDGMIPSKQKEITKSTTTKSCDWEECFDDTSGFPYYWNVNTNDVTWEVPAEYKKWKAQQKKPKPPRTTQRHQIYKPETQLFPSVPISQIPDTIIYKIGEIMPKQINKKDKSDVESKIDVAKKMAGVNKRPNDKRKRHKSPDDSEDEKITLISSYGGDTESENEDDDDEEISRKSKVTLPAKDVQNKHTSVTNTSPTDEQKVTGIALLANYGESDDEEDTKQVVFIKVTSTQNREKVAQSTLFPIRQLIDASQFDGGSSTKQPSKAPMPNSATDEQKVYQRKRRIGLELPAHMTRKSDKGGETSISDGSRTGFGFNSSSTEKYAKFKSAGAISFVKSDGDTLSPDHISDATSGLENADVLKEKLAFLLCEGKEDVSPVQIMLIQLETLQTARLAGCLQSAYLHKWLQETNGEISKLEKDSTPDGWHLEWDREQKRYSYRHLHTGRTQWEYPAVTSPTPHTHTHHEPPTETSHPPPEDMDISTTPPPPPATTPTMAEMQFKEQDHPTKNNNSTTMDDCIVDCQPIEGATVVEMEAPPAPMIGRVLRPVPPPPPVLTEADMLVPPLPLMPEELPPPPPPPPEEHHQPGVENTPKNAKDNVKSECLNTVLDSFYSDIAAIESSIIINNIPEDVQKIETSSITNAADVIPVEVKKRKKLKMSQGLSMKKKGVSKLVEKWKNVQKNLD